MTIPSNHRPWAPRVDDPDYVIGSRERAPILARMDEARRSDAADKELREIHQRRLERAFTSPTD